MAFPSRRMTEEEAEFVDRQMDKHMKTGAYRVVEPHEVHVVNPLLVEPKKGKDGFRLVLDARFPNSYLAYAKFKLSSLQTDVPPLVRPGDHLFTVDLEAAYYSVPLAESAWGKMGWTHRGRHFVTSVLPFGVTIAPLVFTKIVHAIRELFHVLGVRMTDYLDDFLFAATPEEAKELAEFVRWLLKLLGWGFSDKGTLTPAHRVEFLGVIIDTHRFVFEVQPAKAAAALALAQRILTALETGHRSATCRYSEGNLALCVWRCVAHGHGHATSCERAEMGKVTRNHTENWWRSCGTGPRYCRGTTVCRAPFGARGQRWNCGRT